MRSLLMVPAHRPRCLEKCLTLNADALVFDLEDSVPVGKKADALMGLEVFLRENPINKKTFVRVNPENAEHEILFLRQLVFGFMIPKVKFRVDIPLICQELHTLLVIETPMAVLHLESLLGMPSVIGGVFGVGDYSAEMGVIDRPWAADVNFRFAYAKQRLATVARAYGKQALDTSFYVKGVVARDYTKGQWQEAAAWGFTGASPIHPDHVPIANEIFSTSKRERLWSEGVLDGASDKQGEVYVDSEGFVVGPPHVRQAKGKIHGNDRIGNGRAAN